jgi:hypothetical protein
MPRILSLVVVWSLVAPTARAQFGDDPLNTLSDFDALNTFDWVTDVELFGNDGYLVVSGSDTGFVSDPDFLGLITFDQMGEAIAFDHAPNPTGCLHVSHSMNDCAVRLSDGGFAMLTNAEGALNGLSPYLLRLNDQLDTIWCRSYALDTICEDGFRMHQLLVTPDQGFALCGYRPSLFGPHLSEAVLIRTDADGNELGRSVFGAEGYHDLPYGFAVMPDSGFFLVGGQNTNFSCRSGWFARLHSDGEVAWTDMYTASGTCDNQFNAVAHRSAGGYVLTGACTVEQEEKQDLLTLGLNESGETQWVSRLRGRSGFWNTGLDVLEHPNGNFYISGMLSLTDTTWKGSVACLSAEGDSLWQYAYSCADTAIQGSFMRLSSIILDHDGNSLVCAGIAPAFPDATATNTDVWLIRIQPDGCLIPGCNLVTGITEQVVGLSDVIAVQPNPARGRVLVHVSIPEAQRSRGAMELTITSSDGRRIWNEPLQALAVQDHDVDLAGLPSGLYYLHLSAGSTWLAGQKLMVE